MALSTGSTKLIAWDTSTKSGAISAIEVGEGGTPIRLVAEFSLNVEVTHSERLLWAIHQILESARWTLSDVSFFGVGIGPGSFTGLRVGITTARTLAHALKKPLVGVSSLAALIRPIALNFSSHETAKTPIVIAATDACKGELFVLAGNSKSVLECVSRDSLWNPEVFERVARPEDLISDLKQMIQTSSWVVVGEGRQRYLEFWSSLPQEQERTVELPFANQIQGRYLGLLAWESFRGGFAQKPLQVHPRYLRAPDAELKLKARIHEQSKA